MVAGLSEILSLFPETLVDGWTLAGWLRSPDPELGGVPVDALRQGRLAEVMAVARDAATSHKRAAAYGITLELVTMVPYGQPCRWAAAWRARPPLRRHGGFNSPTRWCVPQA